MVMLLSTLPVVSFGSDDTPTTKDPGIDVFIDINTDYVAPATTVTKSDINISTEIGVEYTFNYISALGSTSVTNADNKWSPIDSCNCNSYATSKSESIKVIYTEPQNNTRHVSNHVGKLLSLDLKSNSLHYPLE